jgi:hypothetical protein
MNPFIIDDSCERYQNRLHEAEQWRLANPTRTERPSRLDRLRVRIGDQLITLGHYLKAIGLSEPQFDEAPPA